MTWRRGVGATGMACAVVLLGLLCVTWVLAGGPIDNWLGVIRGRDLKEFLSQRPADFSVQQLVDQRCHISSWRTYHVDGVFATVVEATGSCDFSPHPVLRWEVAHEYSPHPAIPKRALFVCALTPDAAVVTPMFAPPGLEPADYPGTSDRRSSTLYGWATKNWVNDDPTRIERPKSTPCPPSSQESAQRGDSTAPAQP